MPYLICEKCRSYKEIEFGQSYQTELCPWCNSQTYFQPDKPQMLTQLPLPLPKGFSVPGPKTLKPDVDETLGLAHLVTEARTYLNGQTQYTKIEFKFERNWIVVAKLKE